MKKDWGIFEGGESPCPSPFFSPPFFPSTPPFSRESEGGGAGPSFKAAALLPPCPLRPFLETPPHFYHPILHLSISYYRRRTARSGPFLPRDAQREKNTYRLSERLREGGRERQPREVDREIERKREREGGNASLPNGGQPAFVPVLSSLLAE